MDGLKQVVVGIDFSESSRNALAQGVRLARQSGASVRAVHVIEKSLLEQLAASLEHSGADVEARAMEHARFGIERMIGEVAGATNVRVDVHSGSAAGVLAKVGEEIGGRSGSLVVMGAFGQEHREGVGTTAGRCVRHGPADVLLVRPEQKGPFKRIVACVDFSETAARALREAARLARHDGAVVHALNVFIPPPPAYPVSEAIGMWPIPAPDYPMLVERLRESATEAIQETVSGLAKEFPGVQIEPVVVEESGYARGICRYAKEQGADLVVIGTHGRTNLRYMLLGSTAEKVLREVHCSVLAVKPLVHGDEKGEKR